MDSPKPTDLEMWWPAPEALSDLIVKEAAEGFTLSAPDNTECADWLNFWNQSEEHHQCFNEAFVETIRNYLDILDLKNGETEAISDQQSADRVEAEENGAGSLS
jgi:hypothetical protein